MAIKHSDPRKLHDLNTLGNRLYSLAAEAWLDRHETDSESPPGPEHEAAGRGHHRAAPASNSTHHPFADLKSRMTRH